jgi:hypothetical protein
MKLKQMKRTAKGSLVTFRSDVTDRKGHSGYEVTVEGPKSAVEKALGETDFLVDIDPAATDDDVKRRVGELLEPYGRELVRRAIDPASLKAARVPVKDAAFNAARAITVTVRPTAEHRTFWLFDTTVPIGLPPGPVPFQVVFPPCFTGGMASFPIAGNPNVRIRFNSPLAPNAAASALPGLAIDATSFALSPFTPVFPFYQWPVAAAPAAARLICWGFGIFP